MTWLSGKFKKVIPLCWPTDDASKSGLIYGRSAYPYSLLDDQILHVIPEKKNAPVSYIYLAWVYEALRDDVKQVTFAVCAVLPYVVHRVALLPERTGFASLTYHKECFTITLRVHDWDGSVVKEVSTHAKAAYAHLVVQGDLIGICVSSGEDLGVKWEVAGYHPPSSLCVDFGCDPDKASSLDYDAPFADEIIVWNHRTALLRHVRHRGTFNFVDQTFIALGGTLSDASEISTAVLCTFSLSGDFFRAFSYGSIHSYYANSDFVSRSSSSKSNDILVGYHRGGRTTIFKKDLLKDIVDSSPDSLNPPGFHMVQTHKSYFRTITGIVNDYLPAVCDNRVLVFLPIPHSQEYALYIYDFDQARCNALLDNQISLEDQIKADNEDAEVTIVQRNYCASTEDDQDMEYPKSEAPPEWQEHLQNRRQIEKERKEGEADTPVLEFDEGPLETKENTRLKFTRSLVSLPLNEYGVKSRCQLALSPCGIIHVPLFHEQGHIFVFDD